MSTSPVHEPATREGPGSAPARGTVPAAVRGRVEHRRTRPFGYAFATSTPLWLVDVSRPNAGFPRWLSWGASIRSRDHFGPGDAPLQQKVRDYLDAQGLDWSGDRVLMLAGARAFGYVFDPLSTFFCFDAAGRLEGVLAEVHNTYGQRHCYPLPVTGSPAPGTGTLRAEVDKDFYVSPFFTVEGRYEIRARISDDDVAVRVSLFQDEAMVFSGSVRGALRPVRGAGDVLRTVLRTPLPSQRASALIRWHGVRLWLRRLPVVPRPAHEPPKGMS